MTFFLSLLVLFMREHLKMIRVTTDPVVTFVVDLFFPRYETKEITEHDDVNCDSLAIQTETTVTTTTSVAGGWSLPFPTARIVIDNDTSHDFVKDSFPTTRQSADQSVDFHNSSFTTR